MDEISQQKTRVRKAIQLVEPHLPTMNEMEIAVRKFTSNRAIRFLESAYSVTSESDKISAISKIETLEIERYSSLVDEVARLVDVIAFHALRIQEGLITLEDYRERQRHAFNELAIQQTRNHPHGRPDDRGKYFFGLESGGYPKTPPWATERIYHFSHKMNLELVAPVELQDVGTFLGALFDARQFDSTDYFGLPFEMEYVGNLEISASMICDRLKDYLSDLDCETRISSKNNSFDTSEAASGNAEHSTGPEAWDQPDLPQTLRNVIGAFQKHGHVLKAKILKEETGHDPSKLRSDFPKWTRWIERFLRNPRRSVWEFHPKGHIEKEIETLSKEPRYSPP